MFGCLEFKKHDYVLIPQGVPYYLKYDNPLEAFEGSKTKRKNAFKAYVKTQMKNFTLGGLVEEYEPPKEEDFKPPKEKS